MRQTPTLLAALAGIIATLTVLFPARVTAQDTGYTNPRFGFTVRWLAQGAYTVVEADNGDGITLTDDGGMTAKVYGTMSYAVMGQDFAAMEADMRAWLDTVTLHRTPAPDTLVLSGYKGDRILYIKALYGDNDVCVLYMEYPRAAKEHYDAQVTAMSRSFARTSPTAVTRAGSVPTPRLTATDACAMPEGMAGCTQNTMLCRIHATRDVDGTTMASEFVLQ